MKIAVLGAGAWGTAIAINLASRHAVALWARNSQQCAAMRELRVNERYLPGHALPDHVRVTDDIVSALEGADFALIAVTAMALRDTVGRVASEVPRRPLIWLCKGFEPGRALL